MPNPRGSEPFGSRKGGESNDDDVEGHGWRPQSPSPDSGSVPRSSDDDDVEGHGSVPR